MVQIVMALKRATSDSVIVGDRPALSSELQRAGCPSPDQALTAVNRPLDCGPHLTAKSARALRAPDHPCA